MSIKYPSCFYEQIVSQSTNMNTLEKSCCTLRLLQDKTKEMALELPIDMGVVAMTSVLKPLNCKGPKQIERIKHSHPVSTWHGSTYLHLDKDLFATQCSSWRSSITVKAQHLIERDQARRANHSSGKHLRAMPRIALVAEEGYCKCSLHSLAPIIAPHLWFVKHVRHFGQNIQRCSTQSVLHFTLVLEDRFVSGLSLLDGKLDVRTCIRWRREQSLDHFQARGNICGICWVHGEIDQGQHKPQTCKAKSFHDISCQDADLLSFINHEMNIDLE